MVLSGGVEVEESRTPSLVVPKSAQLHTTGVSGCPSRTSASLDPGAISEIFLGFKSFGFRAGFGAQTSELGV